LPRGVLGPVDFLEFWRLAASLRGEIILVIRFLDLMARNGRLGRADLETADLRSSIRAMLMNSPCFCVFGPVWFPECSTLGAGKCSHKNGKYFRLVGVEERPPVSW